MRKNEAVFLKTQNSIFSIVAGSAWFVFCFRLNICTRFQICCYLLEPRGLGTVNLDRPLKSSKTINIIREIFILNALLRISSLCKGCSGRWLSWTGDNLIQERLYWNWLGWNQYWSSSRGGRLNRFDCICSFSIHNLAMFTIHLLGNFLCWLSNQPFLRIFHKYSDAYSMNEFGLCGVWTHNRSNHCSIYQLN